MGRRWPGVVLVALTSVSVAGRAQDKQPLTLRERTPLTGPEFSQKPTPPPQEFRDVMRMNQRVLAVDNLSEGPGGAAGGAAAPTTVTTFGGSLGKNLTPGKEDYDGVLKDTATLKETFAKVEAFFADRKSTEGVQLAKDGEQAIADLETAAKAKNRVGAVKAQIALSVACRNCHIGHRVLLITMPIGFGVVG
jgi:hypothetical protein